MSEWLHEVLSPHVDELVVLSVLPGSRGPKSDALDAFGLANKLRLGDVETAVFKGDGRFKELREMARVYAKVNEDVVRAKNRIKSLFRSRGISSAGKEVYRPDAREKWLGKLPKASRLAAGQLFAVHDALESVKSVSQQQLIAESHRHPESRFLETIPGMGQVRVAQSMAIVVTPHRFRNKRQFWSYCGFGIVMRSSSDWVRHQDRWVRTQVLATRGLNPRCNRRLKQIFNGAATTVCAQLPQSPLGQHYARLIAGETKPNLAKLTIARKLAALFLALWKKQEAYDPEKQR